MKLIRFKQLLESKLGNVKTLINEDFGQVSIDTICAMMGMLYNANMMQGSQFGYSDTFSFASDKKELFSKLQELRDSNSTDLNSIPQELNNLLTKVMEILNKLTPEEKNELTKTGKSVRQTY